VGGAPPTRTFNAQCCASREDQVGPFGAPGERRDRTLTLNNTIIEKEMPTPLSGADSCRSGLASALSPPRLAGRAFFFSRMRTDFFEREKPRAFWHESCSRSKRGLSWPVRDTAPGGRRKMSRTTVGYIRLSKLKSLLTSRRRAKVRCQPVAAQPRTGRQGRFSIFRRPTPSPQKERPLQPAGSGQDSPHTD
jgi:hypothetical protein